MEEGHPQEGKLPVPWSLRERLLSDDSLSEDQEPQVEVPSTKLRVHFEKSRVPEYLLASRGSGQEEERDCGFPSESDGGPSVSGCDVRGEICMYADFMNKEEKHCLFPGYEIS